MTLQQLGRIPKNGFESFGAHPSENSVLYKLMAKVERAIKAVKQELIDIFRASDQHPMSLSGRIQ